MRLVVLAAGRSSRMGYPKGTIDAAGRPLLERQILAFHAAGGGEHAIVAGVHSEVYQTQFPEFSVVFNAHDERGPFFSLQLGLKAFIGHDWTFVTPVDVPCVNSDIWRALFAARNDYLKALVPEYRGRGGHPVLLSPTFVAHLSAIGWQDADARLDRQIQTLLPEERCRVALNDPHITRNFNSPGDINFGF